MASPRPWIPSQRLIASFRRAENGMRSPTAARMASTSSSSSTRMGATKCAGQTQMAGWRNVGSKGITELGKMGISAPAGRRQFSEGMKRGYKTVQEQRSRYKSGPFSWQAGLLFLGTGAGLIFYFRYEKERMERKRIAEMAKGVGRPKVGGPFDLLDQDGKKVTEEDLKGKYSLVYFGFTHCPDICPEELDKMATMIDLHHESHPNTLLPVFITCDPARDTPAVMKSYLAEFHPALIGLTGTWEQIKSVCKAYRVYFSTPEGVKPGMDYLVDHSIYFYLMDPEGDFVEAIGKQQGPEEAAKIIGRHVGDWRGPLDRSSGRGV